MKHTEDTLQATYVLTNKKGEVIRTLRIESASVVVLKRLDTKRVQIVSDTKELDDSGISYEILGESTRAALKKNPIAIASIGELKLLDDNAAFTPTHELNEEKDTQPFFMRWVALAHVATLLLIFSIDFTYEYITEEEKEVIHVVQQIKRPQPKAVTVQASEKKIKKVTRKVVPTKSKRQAKVQPKPVVKSKAPRHAKAKPSNRTQKSRSQTVTSMGALGVLGGANPNANGSGSSLQLGKATGSGSGRGSRGARGGHNKALKGSGVVAGNMGSGERAQGGGGYGTKGKAGGSAGYGNHSLIGSSAGYFQPLSSEAFVEGGLDRGQIAAVMNRNKGKIAACYERGLQTEPHLKGRVSLDFVVNSAGRVSAASIGSSSLRSAQVEGCIVRHLRGFKFPKPEGGVNVKVTFPFDLNRVG